MDKQPKPVWKLVLIFVLIVFGPFLFVYLLGNAGLDKVWMRAIAIAVFCYFVVWAFRKGKTVRSGRLHTSSIHPAVQTRNYFMRKYELRKEEERWEATREERQAYLLALRHRIVQRLIPILVVAFILVLAIIILRR